MSAHGDGGAGDLVGNPLLEEHRRAGAIGRRHPVRQRLVRRYANGIPNDAALDAIADARTG